MTCPPGQYEYKAALNGNWDVNYGADGVLNGSNIVLDHPGGAVTFRYDNSTHVISAVYASQQPRRRGRGRQPEQRTRLRRRLGSRLRPGPADAGPGNAGVEAVRAEPAGRHLRVQSRAGPRLGREATGPAAYANGGNISYKHDGGPVTFRYDHVTHLLTAG